MFVRVMNSKLIGRNFFESDLVGSERGALVAVIRNG
jgi:hypothetical protein